MKLINHTKNTLLLYLAAFLIFSGCSTGRFAVVKSGGKRLMIPAGVDSTVAAQADSIADGLFVSLNRENRSERYKSAGMNQTSKSDTLWKYLSEDFSPTFEVSSENETKAVEAFNKGAVSLQKLAQLDQQAQDAYTKIKAEELLLDAKHNFEKAIVLNPFDLETRSWLARVYQTLAIRFLDDNNNERAIKVLENLTRIEQGEHTLFARLGESYYALKEWAAAHHNFSKAESVMRGSAGLDFSEDAYYQNTSVDTAALFYYTYYQGDTEIKMYDSETGVATLNRALQYASTAKERADIHSYIEWIDWDGGNTRGVEARDKFIALQEKGEYKDATKGFEKLISKLRTKRATDEISWRLAVLEFQFLDRQNKGIERLKKVVHQSEKSAGAPADTSYQRYFNSYGVMCHNLGLENIRKNRKFAFMYFQQAAAVQWESRAKSLLEIAKMSRNNPKSAVKNCKLALETPEQLDSTEQMQVYQLLVEGLKRSGRFQEARQHYTTWMQMRNGNRRASR